MKKISMLATALIFCLNLISANYVQAEVTEEIILKDNRLVVYQVEKIRTEIENYPPPPFEVPDEKLSEIRNIIKKGEGEYVFKETPEKRSRIVFDFPMKEQYFSIASIWSYKEKSWQELPDRAHLLSEENQILFTFFLLLVATCILTESLFNQWERKGDKKLLIFYASLLFFSALLGYVGSYYMSSAYSALCAFVYAVIVLIVAIASCNYLSSRAGISSLSSFVFALLFFASGQGIEFMTVLSAFCALSYLLAKTAKWIFWSKNEPHESNGGVV